MRTTDFYDDVNQQTLYALDKLTGVPEFVKTASIETKDELGRLPAHVFADPQHRKFPVHTKAACWLANAYFKRASSSYSNEEKRFIQDRITKAAAFWKISTQVDEFDRQWDRLHVFHAPKDLPDEQYALIYKTASHTIRKFPMPNAACVRMAGESLYADRHRYTYPMRKFAARRILRAQKEAKVEFDSDTTTFLNRASGEGSAIPLDVAVKLAQRAIMIKHEYPDLAMKLAEISEAIENEKYLPAEKLEKLAGLVDSVDQSTGLYRYYYEGVPMPEEFIFNIHEKEAQAFLDAHVELTTGTAYPLSQLKKLPLAKIAEVLGQDFADAVSVNGKLDWDKFAEVAPTLPRDDAKLLDSLLKNAEYLVSTGRDQRSDSNFPPTALGEGVHIEKEHTDDPSVAKTIAKDHLQESDRYYDELGKMENKLEKGKEKESEVSKTANFDPAKLNGKNTEQLFKDMGAEVEDGASLDFKKIIKFKTVR